MTEDFGGLLVRAPLRTDIPAWAELVARIAEAERHTWFEKAEDLETFFELHDADSDAVLAFDHDGVPRAHGRLTAVGDGAVVRTEGGVDPAWLRRGIGRAVLRWQQERAGRLAAERGLPGVALRAQHEDHVQGPARLLESERFEIVRWFNEMHRGLDGLPPARPIAPGYELLEWTTDLDEQTRLLHNLAFAGHWGSAPRTEESWARRIGNPEVRRDWSFVVREISTGSPVAYHLGSHDPEIERLHGRTEGYTELIGVHPGHRGRGLARHLLEEALRRYAADGMSTAALDMDSGNGTGALALYEGLGYRVVNRAPVWEKTILATP